MTAKQLITDAKLHDTFWGEAIIEAEARGAFIISDRLLAGSWTTCACGKQDLRIPRRDFGGPPIDSVLYALGGEFCTEVHKGRFIGAAQRLIEIEKRSAEILAGLIEHGN